MKLVIKEFHERQRHSELPWQTRFKLFFTLKKRRFFYLFLIYMYYKYHERAFNYMRTRKQRSINKYKRRWLSRFNPEAATYQSAVETTYQGRPAKLSQETGDRLGEAFIRVDRQLKNGFSRQLLINILNRVSFMARNNYLLIDGRDG
jgi:alpha-galactosidase/6-phospho-beta-glucosidase family protein